MTNLANSSRGRLIAYWVTTALVAFQLGSGGAGDILRIQPVVEGMAHLGYPGPLLRDPRRLEGPWRSGGARPALSPAQGVGLRRHGV